MENYALCSDKEFHTVRYSIINTIGQDRFIPDKYMMMAFDDVIDIQDFMVQEIRANVSKNKM